MEFFGLFHKTQSFSVTFGRRHAVIVFFAVFEALSLIYADNGNGLSVKISDTAHDCGIVPEISVTVKFYKLIKYRINIIFGLKSEKLSCSTNLIPYS